MRRQIGVFAVLAALALAGCSASSSGGGGVLPPLGGSGGESGLAQPVQDAQAGDTVAINCPSDYPCQGQMLVEEITWGGACKNPDVIAGDRPGMQLLQISAIVQVDPDATWTAGFDKTAQSPELGAGDDGEEPFYTERVIACRPPAPYQMWGLQTYEGEKTRVYGAWFVPEDVEYVEIGKGRFKVADMAAAPGTLLSNSELIVGNDTPQRREPKVLQEEIEHCGARGQTLGFTMYRSMNSGWSQNCEDKMKEQYGL